MTSAFPDAEEQWASFLQNSIWGLEAAGELLKEEERRKFLESRSDWFRRGKRRIPRENSVSRALADAFNAVRAQQNISSNGVAEHDLRNISIECEVPRPFDSGISDKANSTDLRLLSLQGKPLDLRIEAKTVTNESDLLREYLGAHGVLRFEDGNNPYTVAPYGGMAAYVVDSDRAAWSAKVKTATEAKHPSAALPFRDRSGLERHTSVHNFVNNADGSGASTQVKVFHLVFEIEGDPSFR